MCHTLTQTDFQHSRNRNQYEHSQVFIQTEQWVHHTIQSPTQRTGRWTIQTGQLLLQTLEFLLQPLDGADPDSTPADRGQGFQDMTRNPTCQIQIANKKYPEFECLSMAETMYYLRRAIHFMNPDQDAMSITYKRFREDKFIIGISYEKMADINFTGVNTKRGSLLVLKLKGTNGALASDEAVQRESGAIVYD